MCSMITRVSTVRGNIIRWFIHLDPARVQLRRVRDWEIETVPRLICINRIPRDGCENLTMFNAVPRDKGVHSSKLASTIAIALLCLSGPLQPAFSHSGLAQDRWNPAHLSNLPPEIRVNVQKWETACGGSLAAAQQFALYLTLPGAQFIALHFDDFRCRNKSVHCSTTGCLHEVYVATTGRYHRVLTVHAHDIRLLRDQNTAVVEISDVSGKIRTLRWNGSRFTG